MNRRRHKPISNIVDIVVNTDEMLDAFNDAIKQESIALLAGRQSGLKSSLVMKNFLYPKLDTKSLDGFIDKLKNSDKYREYNREMDRIMERWTEYGKYVKVRD